MPEVQNVLVGLMPLEGALVRDAHAADAADRRVRNLHRAVGRRLVSLSRRGKLIVARLDDAGSLTFHLGMTGRLILGREGDCRHLRAVIETDRGRLEYHDARRFGRISHQNPGEEDPLLRDMGPEVADADPQVLASRLRGRRATVKSVLLDQRMIAGVGNIYADEALWAAGIHPEAPAGDLGVEELRLLLAAAATVMGEAVARGGSSIRDYRLTDGQRGRMQERLAVYGRAGQPCLRCAAPLERSRVAGRGSSFCPRCQPRPDGQGSAASSAA